VSGGVNIEVFFTHLKIGVIYIFWFLLTNKKARKHIIYRLLMQFDNVKVELGRVELPSKHILQKLSTCLLLHYLSGNHRGSTNQ